MAAASGKPGGAPTVSPVRSRDADTKAQEECEFTIAADLTLYANPLRCLSASIPAKPAQKQAEESGEIIAADLVKYGSPLDDKPASNK